LFPFAFYEYVTKLTIMKTNYTKKIILATLILLGFYTGAKAQSDDQSAYDDQYAQPQTQPAQQQQYTEPAQQYTQPQQQYTQPVDPQYSDQQSFDYYPDANVYYDNSCDRYIYYDGGAWITVNVLPQGISLFGLPRFRVFHRGPQVWLDNAFHRNYYRGGNFNRGGGAYRPQVFNGGGYRGGGFGGGRAVTFNRGGGGFNRGGGGFGGGNHGGGGFGGNRGGGGFGGGNHGGGGFGGNHGGGGFRQAHYR
jgi:hypothetical protein